MRGASVHGIIAELLGKSTGVSRGKGGSMHMFARNFFGGNGIVGAQVPVGAGVAFAQKYRAALSQKDRESLKGIQDFATEAPLPKACTFALYGDGAANQGQVFEVYNMAALMKLPVVFVCENNQYGMGTSTDRSSASTAYFRRGSDYIPGLRVDGMDVLAVREAVRFAKDFVMRRGPLVMELVTYRYQGHSMSDPGTTYRSRDEVQKMRATRDTIRLLQTQILESGAATEAELGAIEARVRKHVDEAVEQAKTDPLPADSELLTDIYAKGTGPEAIRLCEP
jgi:pyruvate dehydrogenase E1 component alpha subunit